MKNKFLIVAVAMLLIATSLAAIAGNQAFSSKSVTSVPDALSGSTGYTGNVFVYSNGTVSNASVIGHSGNTYFLKMNVTGNLTYEMSNSVFDGNGFTANGNGSQAVYASGVTDLVIENLAVVNSTTGIGLYNDSNTVVKNVTFTGSSTLSENMVAVYYSGDITVENSSFLLNSTATSTTGIFAEFDTSMNVSGNYFSGNTNSEFVFVMYFNVFSAMRNTVKSVSNSGDAFDVEDGGSSVFGYNYINNTYYGIYVNLINSVRTFDNGIYNPTYGLNIEYTTTFLSSHDTAVMAEYSLDVEYVNYSMVKYGDFSNASDGSYIGYDNIVTIADSNFSYAESYGLDAEMGSTLNLYNDTFNMGTLEDTAVYADEMPGWVNLVGDYIYAPNGNGFESYYNSPYFNVTNSYINATDDIYIYDWEDYGYVGSVNGATISNNTLVTMYGGDTVYIYYPANVYNIVFSNNTVIAPYNAPADLGFSFYSLYSGGNIVVRNNTFLNVEFPVYEYVFEAYLSNLWVQNNTIVNSSEAIWIGNYVYNAVVTGNTIINASENGIYLYTEGSGAVISDNLIENLSTSGSATDYVGIYLDDTYAGNNIVSRNTVINPGLNGTDIEMYDGNGVAVFGNVVSGGDYGLYIDDYIAFSVFDNSVSGSYYGIYSEGNTNFSYYSNTVTNANFSFYSDEDTTGTVYANTFVDSQSNAPYLYMLDIAYDVAPITFYHNNFINDTTNSTVYNLVSDGYGPIAFNAPLPVGGNYWSDYAGPGTGGIGNTPYSVYGSYMDYYPLTSKWTSPTVTFMETGLPYGTTWSVSLGSSLKTSSTGSIVYSPSNAQYMNETYSISHVSGYVASVTSGSVYLNGVDRVISVSFTPYTYDVTFTESSLPSGTSWSVTLNGNTVTSATSTVTFAVPNGTYSYTIGSVTGFHTISSGNVTVNTGPQSVAVPFAKNLYTVIVNEKGLPAGDTWTLTLNGTQHTSTSDTLSVQIVSGTYTVSALSPSGYSVSLQSSTVTVNNANTTFAVTYSLIPVYTVLVTENGLTSGSSWTFVLNGQSYTTNLSAIVLHVTAGTYAVNATGPSGYTVSLKSTSVTVSGNATITVDFASQHTSSGSGSIYEGIGIGVVIGGVAAALAMMFYTSTGIFSSLKKGKGEDKP